jgi:hypothetical protein
MDVERLYSIIDYGTMSTTTMFGAPDVDYDSQTRPDYINFLDPGYQDATTDIDTLGFLDTTESPVFRHGSSPYLVADG